VKSDPRLAAYEKRVSTLFKKQYSITWNDASGEPELLLNALRDGVTAEDFVTQWAEKYDLHSVASDW
jgi:hypothetical protein